TGARDSLTSAETRERLARLLTQLGDTLNAQVRSLRDSLIGSYLQLWLQEVRDDLLGARTQQQVAALRDELLGVGMRKQVAALRNELLGDSLRAQVSLLRDELLGPATRAAVDSLVNEAIASIEKGYKERIRPLAREEEGWLRNNITLVLIIVGLIVAALLAFGAYLNAVKKRYRKVIGVVAEQIEGMEDKKVHESLTKQISEKALREGVEVPLREILKEEGIIDAK
ncbi:MAG: hypothetical protein ACRDGA_02095, partial [Bacteroidota bacterium]